MSIEDEVAALRRTIGHLKDRQDILDCIQHEAARFLKALWSKDTSYERPIVANLRTEGVRW